MGFMAGSSPHLRGTLLFAVEPIQAGRFIPAPAGNTIIGYCMAVDTPVHPRTCGEHWAKFKRENCCRGSSPHLRGTRSTDRPGRPRSRFIPAPAGNTRKGTGRWPRPTVHPRTCGEHKNLLVWPESPGGSSPHLRGTRPLPFSRQQKARFIPHLRGTLKEIEDQVDGLRFIPAPAGNTLQGAVRRDVGAVHPRTCGEHQQRQSFCGLVGGSSPHLRGTLLLPLHAPDSLRFIPAPAGNTRGPARPSGGGAVHPRTCGEHRIM